MSYPKLPVDAGMNPMQEFPFAKKALTRYAPENASASSVVTLTHNTTTLEVAAVGAPAVIRWIPRTETAASPAGSVISDAGTANFDNVVPVGTVRRFAVPIEVQGGGVQSIQGINRADGLYQRVAYKSIGVASVLVTEY